ncbi:ABC transporter permease [Actinomadura chibensis]|uniref:ABC transporter permease n=1 Tax=Actinomadura chibensis TaxID=392828 RepID=A0A5D0NI43_9ACTN|nr:ABC transporter permease [Actinomadura chibensis]TYB44106.1 ABC transporter permease [Actinomadura chibensis]
MKGVVERARPAEADAAVAVRRRRQWVRRLGRGRSAALGFVVLCLLVTVLTPFLPLADPTRQDVGRTLADMSGDHWLGTDQLGRDLFSRLLWGIRTSMFAALTAVGVAAAIGVPTGLLAGYRRGWIDGITGRIADVVLTVPALILLLTVQAALRTGIEGQMVTLGVIFAPRIYRVVRAETMRLAVSPFVTAGRMSGCSHTRIVWRYLLPGVRDQAAVQVSYLLGLALVVEAGISFLGVGVQPPGASLGTLLTGASAMLASEPRVVLVPAAVITVLILCLNLLGDADDKEDRHA